jgi:predicted DNA-binding protein
MSNYSIKSTSQKQYPLRISHELHIRFTNISSSTKIPKSTLGRIGLMRFLDDIESKGITSVLKEMESI